MKKPNDYRELGCEECKHGAKLDFEIDMAFQPIVNVKTKKLFAHEALVRGPNNEGAGWVFNQVGEENRYRFDQNCRIKAIQRAAELGKDNYLCINFLPNAVYQPELCIKATLAAANTYQFPLDKLIFEFTESEQLLDHKHILNIVKHYQALGFKIAIDDFGAGYSGLNLLADVDTDYVKLDMALIRDIDKEKRRQIIVAGIVETCRQLNIELIAEGIETKGEYLALADLGIELFQGYYFAKPAFKSFPNVSF